MDFEKRIAQYRQLRDMIEAEDKAHEEKMKPKRAVLETLSGILLSMLNQSGQQSANTAAGTAYITEKVSATIADAAAFKRHVIGAEAWDLIDWRANKIAVKEFVAEVKDAPPGINYSVMRTVGVRKPTTTTEEE